MLSNFPQYLANARKAIVQVIGLISALLALGLLPAKYAVIGATVVSALTTVLHYTVSNSDAPGNASAIEEVNPDEEGEVEPEEQWKPAELITANQVVTELPDANPPTT